ncbi:phosphatidate cytidylyltransferase [Flavobacterium lacus]|jgi:phosphatidate cytidylyltransferase|uniref:Phosphatidate cytidylyltransferase n=1 Tax=Flavobacterium lacus TaxID=1353778 RepID=A0A328X032_9FLAO|nr:phosphatidate cytidylyltransferase [Flavobacterium lacus]RAR50905.1 phosphatidate cytidylyltransferase [Flavobacterium lacus]
MNETLIRALSGAVYVLLLLSCILYSNITFYILFGLFLALAVLEFCKLVRLNYVTPLIIAVVSYIIFYNTPFNALYDGIITLISILVAIQLIFFLFSKKDKIFKEYEKWLYVVGYIILPFIILTKIPIGVQGYNPRILMGIFILIWTNDTFAYVVGKSIGKHKLFERISPKKTIEGFFGGLTFSVLGSIVIAKFLIGTANIGIWIGIAILVSIFATLGDLIQSKFKRLAGVKDSGKIMPGHGGILDRLDSIIYVAPFIFLFYQILNYVS